MTADEIVVWETGRRPFPVRDMSRRTAVAVGTVTYLAMALLTVSAHGRELAAQHRADTAEAKNAAFLDAFARQCPAQPDGSAQCVPGSVRVVVGNPSHAR